MKFPEDIPAYVAGRLDAESTRQVAEYLAQDPEAKALAVRWSSIARGLREGGEDLLTEHPATDTLLRFADRGRPSERDEIARHVETCASCSLEVTSLRGRSKFRAPARRTQRTMIYRFSSFAAAAGIVLGIGIGVIFESQSPGTAFSAGAVDLLTLDPSLRGDDAVISFRTDPSQPFVPVVVAPVLPDGSADEERFGFVILRAGDVVWSAELTAGEIRERLGASGVVTFLVPTVELSEGRHALEIRALAAPDSLPLLEVPFEIR